MQIHETSCPGAGDSIKKGGEQNQSYQSRTLREHGTYSNLGPLQSTSSGPDGLPVDLGQLEDLILRALNSSMKAGYSKEHQTMIKRYFNFLSRDNYLLNNADDLNE